MLTLIEHSKEELGLILNHAIKTDIILKKMNIKTINDVYMQKKLIVDFSEKKKKNLKELREFLRSNMYNHKKVMVNTNMGKKIIKKLFQYLCKNHKKYVKPELFKKENKERVISDFIAGMTDRYAINLHKKIK